MKDKKIMWFDVETSGLCPKDNDITQFACKFFINGELVDQMNEFCQPLNWDSISEEALKITGKTIEEYKTFQTPRELYLKMLKLFGKYIKKFDKKDKFYLGGYNVCSFDSPFLSEFFLKQGDKWLASWTNFKKLDPLVLAHWLDYQGKLSLPNYTLETIAKYFGFDVNFHDAFDDIDVTIQIYYKLYTMILGMNNDIL